MTAARASLRPSEVAYIITATLAVLWVIGVPHVSLLVVAAPYLTLLILALLLGLVATVAAAVGGLIVAYDQWRYCRRSKQIPRSVREKGVL